MEYGKRIRQKREEAGISQEQLAELVGYSGRAMISYIEKSAIDLPVSKLKKIADALNTTVAELLGESNAGHAREFWRGNMTIYAIQHNVTGRVYVGRTKNLEQRYFTHMTKLRTHTHTSPIMQKDFDEYGEDYSVFILERTSENLKGNEFRWMELLNTNNPEIGYNGQDPHFKMPLKSGMPKMNGGMT